MRELKKEDISYFGEILNLKTEKQPNI